jgi:hypothetical protein
VKKLYRREVEHLAQQFLSCERMDDLERLGFAVSRLKLLALNPPYYVLEVPKSNGFNLFSLL